MSSIEKIKEVIEPIIKEENLNLHDLNFTVVDGKKALQVVICFDDYSMDIDTCERVSNLISEVLDQNDLIPDSYYLDVCSPGAERELKSEKEIEDSLGEYVHVSLKDPKSGFDQIEGYLKEVNESSILIEYKEKTRTKTFEIDKENISLIRLACKL